MSNLLVSICIPNYNNGKYLNQCIQSALIQTYKNIEIVVVDDASTDNSREILFKHRREISIYGNFTNRGQPATTNRAIAVSHGKYVLILHSDDELLPHCIEKLVPLLEDNPDVGMAVGERILTNENDEFKFIPPFYNTNCIIPGLQQAKVFLKTSFLPCQVLVKRDLLCRIGLVNLRHIVNLDGLLWFTCALKMDVAYIQDPVCLYRIHPEQTTAKYNRTIQHMMEYYVTLMEMFRLAKGIPEIEAEFDAAVKNVARVTMKYQNQILANKDLALAFRYWSLANAFDPNVQTNSTHKERNFSYDPPEGSVTW